MDEFVPRPMPDLPPYRIRIKPPMTDEEEAENWQCHLKKIAEILKGYSKEDIEYWISEPRVKNKSDKKYNLPEGQLMLARIIAQNIARDILAEQSEKLAENESGLNSQEGKNNSKI